MDQKTFGIITDTFSL